MANAGFNDETTINANLTGNSTINASLGSVNQTNVNLPPINYIPGYKAAEEERRANETERQENETQRIALYEEMEYKKETGYYKGDKGDKGDTGATGEKGDKGDKGDPGAIKTLVVDSLPATGSDDTIYLVHITPDISGNNYEEYMYINNQWELLGKIGVQVDLTNYATKTYVDEKIGDISTALDIIQGEII